VGLLRQLLYAFAFLFVFWGFVRGRVWVVILTSCYLVGGARGTTRVADDPENNQTIRMSRCIRLLAVLIDSVLLSGGSF
jgi:hypothetical protein